MTVTIKVNYQTTFQKKEVKNKESKTTFYLFFFIALISYMCYSCDGDYKIKGACYEKSSFVRRNQDL